MINENNKVRLEQIYNFICETPDFNKKDNLEKVILFCRNIQDSFPDKLSSKLHGNYMYIYVDGKKVMLNLVEAPHFLNTNKFINWIFTKIKN